MLPGTKFTAEDIVAILRRRFWLVLVPCALASAATAVVARSLPDTYLSQALVSVEPQQVPASFVPSTVTTQLGDRLQAIQNQVLSRPRLEKLIRDFNLYAEERRTGIMQDIVERMKTRDLQIRPVGDVAFRVTYLGREPVSTMKVAQEVASAFINESLVDRANLADQTNEFLEREAEAARLKLVDREQKLAAYRLRYAGELPEQQDANMRAMSNTSAQLQSLDVAVNSARQRQILLERQLATALETPAAVALPVEQAGARRGASQPQSSAVQSLADARRQLDLVSGRYSPLHPDVQRWNTVVKDLEAKAAAEAKASPAGRGLPPGMSPAEMLRQRQIQELQTQLDEIDKQLKGYAANEQRLHDEFAVYRARVEAAPKHQAELTELTRDYDAINASYSGLLRKSEAATLSASLERQEIGEQFKLLEPATLPQRPSSPNRPQITLFGMLAGLGLGVGLTALLEYRDSAFKTDKQVTAFLALPVLAVVPVMQSDQERQRTLVWKALRHVGLGVAVAGCLAVVAYTFVR